MAIYSEKNECAFMMLAMDYCVLKASERRACDAQA